MAAVCKKLLLVVLIKCVCFNEFNGVVAKIEDEPASAVYDVEAVQSGVAKLPCDISPSLPGDKMHIVIWFKEGPSGRKTPIYSYDARDKPLEQGKHWSDEQVLGGRGFFRYQDMPAKLTLDSVKDSDGGVYFCRVDFKKSPTRNVKVNLTIIIPPEKLKVIDGNGDLNVQSYILGPYNEGASINITCVATGGRPPPKVTWWQENALLDDSFEYLSERRVRNVLHLEKLQRKHLHTVFTCQASNNNLVAPISSSVTLDINLRPLYVKLIGDNRPLSAGQTYELSCQVVGARPTPTITWWKGSVEMKNTRITESPDRNTTTSVVTFRPKVEDAGKYLSCRGQVQQIPDSGIEDGWKLDIHHSPIVTLELGSSLNGSIIKEGADVYFECNIKSNPWVYKVSWRHNGKQLFSNVSLGILVTNQSLVLQSVTRARAGPYTCVGSNQEGDGESKSVDLNIRFAPVCRPGQPRSHGVARQEVARIPCELEANPSDVQFFWKFNNSGETIDIPQSHVISDGSRSVAHYTPMTELDYGTLLCWGKNEIGVQKEPCVFYINPAGKPDPLANCTILNQTVEALHVECLEGFDGGLPQRFVMEVYDTQSGKLVSNVTSKTPLFTVGGLESGSGFNIYLYAINQKGRSNISRLQAYTAKSEKHTDFLFAASLPVFLHITPILAALIGIVGALILVAVIIVIVIRLRGGGERDDKDYDDGGLSTTGRRCVASSGGDKASTEPLNKDLNDSVDSLEEKNPDIIPQNNGEDDYQDEERAFQRLNNTSLRIYGRMSSPNPNVKNGPFDYTKTMPHVIYNQQQQQLIPMSLMRRQQLQQDPNQQSGGTLYAQLDLNKRVPVMQQQQPLSPPHPSFQGLQPMPAYIPARQIRDDMHLHSHSDGISAETPLIQQHTRDTNSLQPLLESARNTPTITATLPRVMTTTRF